ncbi:MAG: hypothetical protein WBA89_06480 [Microcoleus sp.]
MDRKSGPEQDKQPVGNSNLSFNIKKNEKIAKTMDGRRSHRSRLDGKSS